MKHQSKYVAKQPDSTGFIHYTDEENQVWHDLITRQTRIVKTHASEAYLQGLELLNLPQDRVPQCSDVNRVLGAKTGWSIVPVAALISIDHFFTLLSEKKFPAASFIRLREELDYLPEPDIFHEVYGHCPLLTNPTYADFMQLYGKIACAANDDERKILSRLYWFTVEFGLMNTEQGLRCYGGGILSSTKETVYALESPIPERRPFDHGQAAMRTPYRIDHVQSIYYVIDNFEQLYELFSHDIIGDIARSRALGDFPLSFPATEDTLIF